ncbi:MAG: HIT family protein [Nanoarchaeota archaeon]|nr:HIT family protein [Nanoarchaeota archaeon]
MEDCIFCKIIQEKIPAEKIYEDSEMLAFLDINPVQPGHLLLIPKSHHEWMTDVPDKLLSQLYIKTKDLMKTVKKSFNADYIVLSVVGVDVPHFHIHIIPRFKNDGLQNFWPTKKYKDENEMSQTADKIRENL